MVKNMDELEQFKTQRPDAYRLREQHPELEDKLGGEFYRTPNVYELEKGTVVSWGLEQDKKRNPTYGRVPRGHFEFPTGEYTELVIILEGNVDAEVRNQDGEAVTEKRTYLKHETIIAPAGTTLVLDPSSAFTYLCEYAKVEAEI